MTPKDEKFFKCPLPLAGSTTALGFIRVHPKRKSLLRSPCSGYFSGGFGARTSNQVQIPNSEKFRLPKLTEDVLTRQSRNTQDKARVQFDWTLSHNAAA